MCQLKNARISLFNMKNSYSKVTPLALNIVAQPAGSNDCVPLHTEIALNLTVRSYTFKNFVRKCKYIL